MRFTFDHIGVYKYLNPRKSILRKGGGGSSETTTRQISMLPEYARPFYENMMERAEAESLGQYTPYEGDRLASSEDFADIGMSKDMIRNIATMDVPGLKDAMNQVGTNIGQIGSMMPKMGQLGDRMASYADKEARQFTGDEVNQYMSPYMDAVIDRQKKGAMLDFDRGQAARDASAVQAGAFGGSRQAVSQYLAEEGLGDRLADIEATGRQQAFEQAAQQFGADRAAQMAQDQFGLGALQGQAGMFGQQLGALGQQAGLAGQYAGLGGQQRAAGIQGAQLLDAIGRSEMGESQAGMDLAYQDFLRQQNFNKDQLGFLSNILQGVPVSPSTQTSQFMPYNPMQQALGAGLTGLSLYRAMV